MLVRTFTSDLPGMLEDFRRSVDQLFENIASPGSLMTEGYDGVFSPAVETGWTDDQMNLRVVLPGVTRDDLKVSVQGEQLIIEGERKAPENFGKEGSTYTSMPYGKFQSIVNLPDGLDTEKVTCNLHDGVLDLGIPVAESMKPRLIPISSGSERKAVAAAA